MVPRTASLKFVIFGLTVSSSWGNGHATTLRGLLRALRNAGHRVVFFERDVPYYAAARDLAEPDFCDLVLYNDWAEVCPRARRELAGADVAMVTSYCADGLQANQLVLDTPQSLHVFYDIDTPVTLANLAEHGLACPNGARYLTPDLIPEFDLYLTFTGGPLLRELESRWGARRVAPLYCSVDPEVHAPVPSRQDLECALGYLGTYSADRQATLDELLLQPARRRPSEHFLVAGAQYPPDLAWPPNVTLRQHLPPVDHAAFYCSSRLTLNVTRAAMVETGWSPSVRLFEAAACGTPIVSDWWAGLDSFFCPGTEILLARNPHESEAALNLGDRELWSIAQAARERTLAEHTCTIRAAELVSHCEAASSAAPTAAQVAG